MAEMNRPPIAQAWSYRCGVQAAERRLHESRVHGRRGDRRPTSSAGQPDPDSASQRTYPTSWMAGCTRTSAGRTSPVTGNTSLAPATCRRTTAAASSSCAHRARSSTTSRPSTDADRDHHDLHPPPSLASAAKGSAPSTATANSHQECCLPLVVSRRPGPCPTHQ
jgi:hypothetical protein